MNHRFAIREAEGITIADGANLDAFGRLRISQAQTIFEVQCQYNTEALKMESGATGTGVAAVHSANTRMCTLQVNSGGAGGTSFMQSFRYMSYQPGKSHFIAMTGVMGAAVAGAVKRFGYGDSLNGIFYEQNGVAGLQFNRRTSTSGSVVNNTVAQSSWNMDKLDGTGPSGITIDPNNCFILIIDLQFLGMGRVRVGFDIGGVIVYAHQFLNANILTVPYIQSASLPVLIEIVASSAIGSSAQCLFKCAQVSSEAGFEDDTGRDFSAEGTVTAASGARTHAISIRPLTTFNGIVNRGYMIPESISILCGTNAVKWELVIGAAFSVAPTYAAVNGTHSFMEAGTGGTFSNLTTGVVIMTGYLAGGQGSNQSADERDASRSYPISLDRAGAVRSLGTLSILLTSLAGASSDCRVALGWREIR